MLDAIVVDPRDNVATAIRALEPGRVTTNVGVFDLAVPIASGHKFAVRAIAQGDYVIKYGEPVGRATIGIAPGVHVHASNVGDILPRVRHRADDLPPDESILPPLPQPSRDAWAVERVRDLTFNGYRRADGRVGVRNQVLVMATVGCANAAVERIARETGAAPITHQQGCLQLGDDLALTKKQLIGAACNPNVGAVLLVGLGCETVQGTLLLPKVKDKPVEAITIQGEGGTSKAVRRGVAIVEQLQQELGRTAREPSPIGALAVATKCGGSDAFSGLTANPACGVACDMLVDAGGAVILSETPGLFGSEPHLAARMARQEDRARLARALDRVWDDSLRLGEALSEGELSPGNLEGGLTTLVEKSLGATTKAGTRPFRGFLEFADRIPGPGLWLMDTPGFDILTISGQVSGGAQIILFTTGRGSPVGCAIAPVIKVCSNSKTFSWMDEDMDIDAGAVISQDKSIEQVGGEIFDYIIATANGMLTKAEVGGHQEYALARIGSTL